MSGPIDLCLGRTSRIPEISDPKERRDLVFQHYGRTKIPGRKHGNADDEQWICGYCSGGGFRDPGRAGSHRKRMGELDR